MKYEILIAANDEADLASGHKRKQQGDIIAVRPYPWNWGRKEIDEYLIVIAEFDDDPMITQKLTQKGDAGEKRKYKIDLTALKANYCPELDITKVENKTLIYQPFKKASQLVEKFDGVNGNYDLGIGEVDTGLSTGAEIVTAKNATNLLYDKTAREDVDLKTIPEPPDTIE